MSKLTSRLKIATLCSALVVTLLCFWGCASEKTENGTVFDPTSMATYQISSSDMEPTLYEGEIAYVESFETETERDGAVQSNAPDLKAGEVVTFADPEIDGRVLIKRIVASADQTVDIREGKLIIDGEIVDEPYVNSTNTEKLKTAPTVHIDYPYTVPEGYVFVLGDNRTSSVDSRYFGAIPADTVLGVVRIAYSPDSDAYYDVT